MNEPPFMNQSLPQSLGPDPNAIEVSVPNLSSSQSVQPPSYDEASSPNNGDSFK